MSKGRQLNGEVLSIYRMYGSRGNKIIPLHGWIPKRVKFRPNYKYVIGWRWWEIGFYEL